MYSNILRVSLSYHVCGSLQEVCPCLYLLISFSTIKIRVTGAKVGMVFFSPKNPKHSISFSTPSLNIPSYHFMLYLPSPFIPICPASAWPRSSSPFSSQLLSFQAQLAQRPFPCQDEIEHIVHEIQTVCSLNRTFGLSLINCDRKSSPHITFRFAIRISHWWNQKKTTDFSFFDFLVVCICCSLSLDPETFFFFLLTLETLLIMLQIMVFTCLFSPS